MLLASIKSNASQVSLNDNVTHMVDIDTTKDHYSSMINDAMFSVDVVYRPVMEIDARANTIVGGKMVELKNQSSTYFYKSNTAPKMASYLSGVFSRHRS